MDLPSWTRSAAVAACIAGAAMAIAAQPTRAQSVTRGKALYEQRCMSCHAQSVHARAKRRARDFNEVREWVERWNDSLELNWGSAEIEDVTVYLNAMYYRYAIPAARGRFRHSVAPSQAAAAP
jgi:cytochrome c5